MNHPLPSDETLNVVLVTESNRLRLRGLDVASYVQKKLGKNPDLSCNLWRWFRFEDPACGKAAARQSVHADLVILAFEGDKELDPPSIDWLKSWGTRPRGDRPIVLGMVAAESANHPKCRNIRESIMEALGEDSAAPYFISHDGISTIDAGGKSRRRPEPDKVLDEIAYLLGSRIDLVQPTEAKMAAAA